MLLVSSVVAQAQFTYPTTNGTVTITGYTGTNEDVIIPAMTSGLPVTSIGNRAFWGYTSLTNVTIPESITSIGDDAFYDTGLTSVTLPDSITSIGDETFADCYSLTAISVAAQNPVYSSLNGVLFDKNQTTLVAYPARGPINYTIPDGVTNIGNGAFYGCGNLASVTIDNGMTSIGKTAFSFCSRLGNIGIPDSVTSIGDSAFRACTGLTNAAIPYSVTNIGDYAFYDTGLARVTIPNGVTNIGDSVFGGCVKLTNVTIGDGVTTIGTNAFGYCGLTNLTIPNSVTSIGSLAFENCFGLTNAYFRGNAPGVDPSAFSTRVFEEEYFSEGSDPAIVYYLSGTAGWSNTFAGLPTVMLDGPPQFGTTADGWNYVSDQVKYTLITGYAGSNSAVIIPSMINGLPVTGIGSHAFENFGVTSVTIPNSVTSIVEAAFAYSSSLRNIAVAEGNPVYSSLNGVLFDRSQTTLIQYPAGNPAASYAIPNGVTHIGDYAFFDCFSLTSVFFIGNAPSVGLNAFDVPEKSYSVADNATVYYVPGTLGWDDFSANTGLPAALWFLPQPDILTQGPGFGVESGQFGFTISRATNVPVVVEAATNLSNPVWLPVSTNTLVGGTSYFTDPQPANLPARFYRLRSP
jgi:hypothetical protein